MRIKQVTYRDRRDFTAIFECESCGFEKTDDGYDDDNYHQEVIPAMECPSCKKVAIDYHALKTKYPSSMRL